MEDISRILVISRITKHCRKAVRYGVSLAQKYGAELCVLHAIHNPLVFGAWNLPKPSLEADYRKEMETIKRELDEIIDSEKKKGMSIKEIITEGDITHEIFETVRQEKIDLIIMLAHEEWRLEHFLFGRSTEEIIRKMPCSVFLVKEDLPRAGF